MPWYRELTRPAVRWVTLSVLAALPLQAAALLRLGALPRMRGTFLLVALGLLAWAGACGASRRPLWPARLLIALGAAGLFWASLLEANLHFGTPYALGFLFHASGFLAHATALFALLTRGGRGAAARLVLRLGLLSCSTLFLLFAVEAAFRLVIPVKVYDIVPDGFGSAPCLVEGENGFLHATPGFRGKYMHPQFLGTRVEINDYGLRDGLDEAVPKREGEASLVVLGDSLVFGTGVEVEETFQERLEESGQEIAGRPLRVFCAALPGDGQLQGLARLEALAARAQPDVVIAAVYEGNDLEDNMRAGARRYGLLPNKEEQERRKKESERAAGPPLPRFLGGVRRVPFWLGSSSTIQFLLPGIEATLVKLRLISEQVPTNQFLNWMIEPEPPGTLLIGLSYTQQLLRELRDRCREIGADLVVLVIPAAIQADPARFADLLSWYPQERREQFERTAFHGKLVAALRGEGLAVVDMLGPLEKEARAGRPAYLREGHWNAWGHERAAAELAPVLRELFAARAQGR